MLTFTVRYFSDDDWIADCEEIPGILTGGTGCTQDEIEECLLDTIYMIAEVDAVAPRNSFSFAWTKDTVFSEGICSMLVRDPKEMRAVFVSLAA